MGKGKVTVGVSSVQLWWGEYAFPVNACGCTLRTVPTRSASGRPVRQRLSVTVRGTLFGLGQAALTAAELLMRNALATPYRDLVLNQDSGAASGIRLLTASAVGGVTIDSGPDFTDDTGSEYVYTRKFVFTASGDFVIPGQENALLSYVDTVSVQGNGGPIRRWRNPVNAGMIRQVTNPTSLVRYTHSGMAVGHLSEPTPPEPVFGRQWLVNESDSLTTDLPTPMGDNWVGWPIRWSYVGEVGGRRVPVRLIRPTF